MLTLIDDPRTIPVAALPLGVLANQTNSLVSSAIDWATNSSVDHAMLMVSPGQFVCQSPMGYNNVPISAYMTAGCRLKFVSLVNINNLAIAAINQAVSSRMALPWYKKQYDWLGIVGQALHLPWIHTPGLEYCSVDLLRCWKAAAIYLPDHDRTVILGIPNESSPSALNQFVQKFPEVFSVYGEYLSDDGVIA